MSTHTIVHPNGKAYTLGGEGYLFDKLTEMKGYPEYTELVQELLSEDGTIDYRHEWIRTHVELQVMLEKHGGKYWHRGGSYRVYFRSDQLVAITKKIDPDGKGPYSFSTQSTTPGHGHFFCLTTRRWSIGVGRFPDSPESILNTVRMLFTLESWTAKAFSLASPCPLPSSSGGEPTDDSPECEEPRDSQRVGACDGGVL